MHQINTFNEKNFFLFAYFFFIEKRRKKEKQKNLAKKKKIFVIIYKKKRVPFFSLGVYSVGLLIFGFFLSFIYLFIIFSGYFG